MIGSAASRNSKMSATIAGATLLISFLPLGSLRPQTARQTALRPSPRQLDFGDRGHSEEVRLPLELHNAGEAPVKILALRASCGCTRVSPSAWNAPIAPDETIELSVTMSSGRAVGTLDKYLEIQTDDSANPLRVPTRMRVFAGFRTQPYQFQFEGEVGGRAVTKSIEITRGVGSAAGGDFSMEIQGVVRGGLQEASLDEYFESRIEDLPRGKRVHLTLKPTHPEGRIFASLKARVEGKSFIIPVTGDMFRGLRLSPRYFNFSRVDAGVRSSFVKVSEISSIDGRAFRLLEIQPSYLRQPKGAEIRVQVFPQKLAGGTKYRLNALLEIPEGAAPDGPFSGKILVKTDHPEKPKVELNVIGFFPAPRAASAAKQAAPR
ncbi:MAG: DUF1573 domain-containing protein [Planctomycetes bacterium]|nr:DUF1573 domain-containing protein [Planctomycetota bacterium]